MSTGHLDDEPQDVTGRGAGGYRLLVENLRDIAVFMTDPGGLVTSWNPGVEHVLGYPEAEFLNQPARMIFTPEDRERGAPEQEMATAEAEGRAEDNRWHLRKDGTCFWSSGLMVSLRDEGGRLLGFAKLMRDATEQKLAEEALREADRRALREYERLLARITDLAQTFATARDLTTIFRALKNFALASVPGSGIFISLYDAASRTRAPVYAWSEGEELDVSALPPMPMSDSPHSRAVSTGEVIITDDFQAAMAGKPVLHVGLERDPRLPQSSLAAPMVEMGRVVGAVEVQSTEPAAYRQEHAAAMRMAANLAAVAVENVRLLKGESRAREAAEESNRLKDEFLATLSHELRTPLTAILGWSKLLRAGSLDAEMAARAIEAVERNAESQKQLIDDILDVSRIITGKLRLDVGPVSLVSVVEGALDSVRPAANAKRITLRVSVSPHLGAVAGDPDRLRQAIWNLLTNAVKFTPEGGAVEVSVARKGSSALIEVTDTGRGIGPEFLPYVFDRFRQADASTTREKGGLGLGLAIVRHIVELHGGTVGAESEGEGRGATFRLTLPLARSGRGQVEEEIKEATGVGSQSAAGQPRERPPALDGLHVLVVDDEDDALDLLRAVFEGCGARVTAASTAAEALRSLREGRPDVLVSDIGMQGEDGYELIRRVRGLNPDQGGRTPAVALTAYAREEDRRKAIRAGFDAHLAKPAAPEELAEVVASLAGRIAGE